MVLTGVVDVESSHCVVHTNGGGEVGFVLGDRGDQGGSSDKMTC